ncbi:50S ribosomal protein L19 [Clostridia bacterium]|nr:50S ribosomal protein L19 [Clostridia bacterium]
MRALVESVTAEQLRTDLPVIAVGDTVEVYVKIKEGTRERVQMFDGTVIAMKNGKRISATFTVRRIAYGVGVEKSFLYNSPTIEKIVVVRHGRVRRAKLYYLRDRVGKAAKIKEKLS